MSPKGRRMRNRLLRRNSAELDPWAVKKAGRYRDREVNRVQLGLDLDGRVTEDMTGEGSTSLLGPTSTPGTPEE